LLASYATGSPLFSINGLANAGPEMTATPLLRCAPPDGPAAVPQDLSMSAARDGPHSAATDAPSFLASSSVATTHHGSVGGGYAAKEMSVRSSGRKSQPGDFRASEAAGGRCGWSNGLGTAAPAAKIKAEDEEATDLSVRGGADASTERVGRRDRSPAAAVADAAGTVDLSSRAADRKPSGVPSARRAVSPRDGAGSSRCADDDDEDGGACPHLAKLKELRRNVYRMLSVFTPYLDVAGAGIADVEADAVDDFLHEVIYSSRLDQAAN